MAAKPAFILLYGDEDFLVDRVVEERRRVWAKRDLAVLDGSKVGEASVVELCETRSLFDSAQRAVIVDNAELIKLDDGLKEYLAARDSEDNSALLMIVLRSSTIPSAWNVLAKRASVLHCPRCKPWEADKIRMAVLEEGRRLNLKLDDSIVDILLQCLGFNLRTIVNELNKLAYVAPGGRVTKEHVARVVADVRPVEPHQVAEAALAKDVRLAMNRASLVFRNLGDGASVPITAALMKQLERTLVARQMLDRGAGVADIARRFEMHEFACKKNLIPVVQRHSTAALMSHMGRLCKLESDVKGPARSKRTLVELVVLAIAGDY
jgi:DNA polymerase III delta subunit